MFVALGIQHSKRMRRSSFYGLPGSTVFFDIISWRHEFREKNVIEPEMCVLIFSITFVSKKFSSLEEMREVCSEMYIGLHVKYRSFLSDFNETWIFSTDFSKNT